MDTNMQNMNTREMMGKGVIVLNVSEMPQENISVEKEKSYLLVGDNAIWLKKIPDNSIDSIVTDPPAGISFMARGWDSDKGGRDNWIKWMSEVATECKRVLKPGVHAFVWAIPRTSHWTATAWENAGFEIRDVVAHIFGSGFPKSHNVEKAIQKIEPDRAKEFTGIGTALKPAREDWLLMRKPLAEKTVAENVLKYGTGGINIDESRVDFVSEEDRKESTTKNQHADFGTKPMTNNNVYGDYSMVEPKNFNPTGRFPANLIHDNSEEVRECFPETGKSTGGRIGNKGSALNMMGQDYEAGDPGYGDSGNASRFFKSIVYIPKASKSERNKGCEEIEEKQTVGGGGGIGNYLDDVNSASGKFGSEKAPAKNNHPTVKPVALMEYLIKMVTPKGGIVLDPFMGSGSTGVACQQNGFDFIGIEMEAEYITIAKARLNL